MLEKILILVKSIIPSAVFRMLQPAYHWVLAWVATILYGFPSRGMRVIGVTGTNGKSTVVHLLNAVLEEAGEKTASLSSLRFRICGEEQKNELKMTMPGRFLLQRFLSQAKRAGCRYVVLEVTSEGIKQFRHVGISFYMAVLTNVTPEHIESHGGFENYRAAKAELFKKAPRHVFNGEDANIEYFLAIPARERIVYLTKDLPRDFHPKLLGDFNLQNLAAAYQAARLLGIEPEIIKRALEKVDGVPGRLEFVMRDPFSIVVDYAHTPDALEKVYKTLRSTHLVAKLLSGSDDSVARRLICVLGACGGGRDRWKRPEMGKIAAEHCDEIILTNEDPYDEDPASILDDIERGFLNIKDPNFRFQNYEKILDRKEAIRKALGKAQSGDIVIITGKGAEPWIMGPRGTKIPWDDREVVREGYKRLKNAGGAV